MNFTFDQLKKTKPKTIYYSANTLWWTTDTKDLKGETIPLDHFGSPLFESETTAKELELKGYDKNKWMRCHAKNINETIKKLVPGSNLFIRNSFSNHEALDESLSKLS